MVGFVDLKEANGFETLSDCEEDNLGKGEDDGPVWEICSGRMVSFDVVCGFGVGWKGRNVEFGYRTSNLVSIETAPYF